MAKEGDDTTRNAMFTPSTTPPPSVSVPAGTTLTASTTGTNGGGAEEVVETLIRTPIVERRQLVSYGDLMSSDSASSSVEPSSLESSSDDTEGLLKTALTLVETEVEGYDLTSPPENGSQFLLQVQHQRKSLPKVVSAKKSLVEQFIAAAPVDETKKFQVVKVPESVVIPSAIHEFLPTQSWISIVIHQFSNLFLKVLYWREMQADQGTTVTLPEGVVLPGAHEKDKWLLFCFGTKLVEQIKSHPRQRNGVKSADRKAIAAFFSDDALQSELSGENVPPPCPTATALETLEATEAAMQELIISQPDNKVEEDLETATSGKSVDEEKKGDDDDESSSSSDSNHEDDGIHEKHPPLLSILLNLPATTVEDVLRMHVAWLKHYGWFHELQGKWIYALLACLEKPLPCAVIGDIRDLVRVCCKVRNSVCESKVPGSSPSEQPSVGGVDNGNETPDPEVDFVEDSSNPVKTDVDADGIVLSDAMDAAGDDDPEMIRFKEFVNTLNLFVCLASNYFQQYDLADPPRP